MEKNSIIILVIGLLCFCLLLSAIGGGGYFYFYDASDNKTTTTPTTPATTNPSTTKPSTTNPSTSTPSTSTPSTSTPTTNPVSILPLDYSKWSSIKNRINDNEGDEAYANRIYDTISGVQDRLDGRNYVRDRLAHVMTVDASQAAIFCSNSCFLYPNSTIQQGYCGNCKKLNPKWSNCSKSDECQDGTSCLITNTTTKNSRCITKDECIWAANVDNTTGKCNEPL